MTGGRETRARAVRLYHDSRRAIAAIDHLAVAGAFDLQRLDAHRGFWQRRLDVASRAYRDVVPAVAVSRCPLTDEVLDLAIDVFGLDGPWWNRDAVCRPLPDPMPRTTLGFDGAVRVTSIPVAPFVVCPGPEVPTVIPRLLSSAGVHAVLSTVHVGRDVAYVTSYFAEPGSTPLPAPPDHWGADHYLAAGFDGVPMRVSSGDEARDADLGPWLDTGRCWWIELGDDARALRQGRDGCPYLGLAGRADPQWLFEGRSSYAPDGLRARGG